MCHIFSSFSFDQTWLNKGDESNSHRASVVRAPGRAGVSVQNWFWDVPRSWALRNSAWEEQGIWWLQLARARAAGPPWMWPLSGATDCVWETDLNWTWNGAGGDLREDPLLLLKHTSSLPVCFRILFEAEPPERVLFVNHFSFSLITDSGGSGQIYFIYNYFDLQFMNIQMQF